MSPPGLLAPRIARGGVVQLGRDARPSRANVRHPAVAQAPTAQPFALDGLPGITVRRLRSVAGRGRAFGACCFAGKLRSPAGPAREPPWPRPSDTYASEYASPYASPYAGHPRTPSPSGSRITAGHAPSWGQSAAKTAADWPPSGGVERPGRKVRFARLIHRPVRVLGGP